ncbi:twin-arginine translocation signal domain-containing protein, partial [Escherichia coli]
MATSIPTRRRSFLATSTATTTAAATALMPMRARSS